MLSPLRASTMPSGNFEICVSNRRQGGCTVLNRSERLTASSDEKGRLHLLGLRHLGIVRYLEIAPAGALWVPRC